MTEPQPDNFPGGCRVNVKVLVGNSHVPRVQEHHAIGKVFELLSENAQTSLPVVVP